MYTRYYYPEIFEQTLDGIDRSTHIMATYYVADELAGEDFIEHFSLIQAMVLEGSTGTWQGVPDHTPEVRQRLCGKMVGYYEVPTDSPYKRAAVVQLAFPIDAWTDNVPMMLLSIAGNCFAFSKGLRLLDVFIPEKLLANFKGPKFGVPGIRELTGEQERPFSLHIIKPKMGMTPEETAAQVYQTALGGADLCKDDEMCSELANCSFEDRLEAVLEALDKAESETGHKTLYMVSITDEVDRVVEKCHRAVELGATGLLLAYSTGLSTLKVLADDPALNVPILLHPSHMLALLPRINFPVLTKLCRLCGADMTLAPSMWSSLDVGSLEEALRVSQTLLAPFYDIKRTWPMPAAGMYPGLAEVLMQEHGIDYIVPAGGGMLGHPMGYKAGAMAWRQAIDAVLQGQTLQDAAQSHPEFRAAAELWGIRQRPETPWGYTGPDQHPKFAPKNV